MPRMMSPWNRPSRSRSTPEVYHAEKWQERLKEAWAKAPDSAKQGDAAEVYRSDPGLGSALGGADSDGALAFYAFKREGLGGSRGRAVEPPADLTDGQLLAALAKAAEWLKANFGSACMFRMGTIPRGP